MKELAIGIFDSGVGGISVMREIVRLMPNENIVYFGDTARVPYGNKSPKTILHYSIENASFLMKQNIKLLVLACHTSCAHALETLQSYFDIPILGVISPGIDALLKATKNKHVSILGTQSTVSSGIYPKLILKKEKDAQVQSIACPLFVPLIEEGFSNHPMMKLAAKEYLCNLKDSSVDTVLLACTHYPLIYNAIRKLLPRGITLVDPSYECALNIKDFLEQNKLQTDREKGNYQFFVSDNMEKFRSLAEKFLQASIPKIELTAARYEI